MRPWDRETRELVGKFSRWTAPPDGFTLRPGEEVVDPTLWRASLLRDIEDGPDSPRGRLGAVARDLQDWASIFSP